MKRITTLVATIGMLAPTLALNDRNYAHWGAMPEQLAQASAGAVKILPKALRKQHGAPWNSETAAQGTYVEGDLHLKLSFSFDLKSGGLNGIVFETAAHTPDKLLPQLKHKFVGLNGPPHTTANHQELGMETFSWSNRKDQIGLTLMSGGSGSFASQCVPGTDPPLES